MAEITFKTDLENCDYQQEHGATRLFEAFKLYQQEEKAKETQEEEDKKDPMKMLEKRTKMSRAEMEAMGKLEELQEINRRHEAFDPDKYLENQRMLQAEELRLQEEKDEEFIRSLYGRTTDGKVIKRILDDSDEEHPLTATTIPPIHVKQEKPEDDDGEKPCCSTSATKEPFKEPSKPSTQSLTNKRPIESSQKQILSKAVIVKKKKPAKEEDADNVIKREVIVRIKEEQPESSNADESVDSTVTSEDSKATLQGPSLPSNALLGLADYGSDSSSD
ncbi:unnamed protein product [Toxocara canis]|uniref:Uncharacterized protein n=1 Tax=Toxocara canis TaxID=6265 RepID=A0A3P7H7A8_TOXCA|nr:unnamed protein product [Toxocara canis]